VLIVPLGRFKSRFSLLWIPVPALFGIPVISYSITPSPPLPLKEGKKETNTLASLPWCFSYPAFFDGFLFIAACD